MSQRVVVVRFADGPTDFEHLSLQFFGLGVVPFPIQSPSMLLTDFNVSRFSSPKTRRLVATVSRCNFSASAAGPC